MSMKKIVIIGAGPHARVCLDILQENEDIEIVGVIDSKLNIGEKFYGYTVIGRQEQLKELQIEYAFSAGFVAVGDNFLREKVVDQLIELNPNFEFVNAISKFSYVSNTAEIGTGNVIMPGVVINSEAKIYNHCIVNTNSSVEHNCILEDYASISAGVVTGGYIHFKKYSAIALGVTLYDRITIGENVVVGSGSLVTKSLEDNFLYYGVPAKKIRERKPGERFLK